VLVEHRVPFVWRPSCERHIGYIGSASFVAGLAPQRRDRRLARVGAVVPEGPIELAFAARCWLTERA
jgi:hypothetical protein